jgi:hypothetical protein
MNSVVVSSKPQILSKIIGEENYGNKMKMAVKKIIPFDDTFALFIFRNVQTVFKKHFLSSLNFFFGFINPNQT